MHYEYNVIFSAVINRSDIILSLNVFQFDILSALSLVFT